MISLKHAAGTTSTVWRSCCQTGCSQMTDEGVGKQHCTSVVRPAAPGLPHTLPAPINPCPTLCTARFGSAYCAEALIASGADVCACDLESRWTPLHLALYSGNAGVALVLAAALQSRLSHSGSGAPPSAAGPWAFSVAPPHTAAGPDSSASRALARALHGQPVPGPLPQPPSRATKRAGMPANAPTHLLDFQGCYPLDVAAGRLTPWLQWSRGAMALACAKGPHSSHVASLVDRWNTLVASCPLGTGECLPLDPLWPQRTRPRADTAGSFGYAPDSDASSACSGSSEEEAGRGAAAGPGEGQPLQRLPWTTQVRSCGQRRAQLGLPPGTAPSVAHFRTISSLSGSGDARVSHSPLAPVAICAVSAGHAHSLALDVTGRVWAWGVGSKGQLGCGGGVDHPFPTPVQQAGGVRMLAVAAGGAHSLAVDSEGGMWSWGCNADGALMLGKGAASQVDTPSRVSGALGRGGAGVAWGVVAVAAGTRHSVAVTDRGQAWCAGANEEGQCGVSLSHKGQGAESKCVVVPHCVVSSGVVGCAAGPAVTLLQLSGGGVLQVGGGGHTPRGVTLDADAAQAAEAAEARSASLPLPVSNLGTMRGGVYRREVGQVSPPSNSGATGPFTSGPRCARRVPLPPAAALPVSHCLPSGTAWMTREGGASSWSGGWTAGQARQALGAGEWQSGRRFGRSAQVVALAAGGDSCLALDEEGGVWEWSVRDATPVGTRNAALRRAGQRAVAIAAGGGGVRGAVTIAGDVLTWGTGPASGHAGSGPIPVPTRLPDVAQAVGLAMGACHTLLLTATALPALPDIHAASVEACVCNGWEDGLSEAVQVTQADTHAFPEHDQGSCSFSDSSSSSSSSDEEEDDDVWSAFDDEMAFLTMPSSDLHAPAGAPGNEWEGGSPGRWAGNGGMPRPRSALAVVSRSRRNYAGRKRGRAKRHRARHRARASREDTATVLAEWQGLTPGILRSPTAGTPRVQLASWAHLGGVGQKQGIPSLAWLAQRAVAQHTTLDSAAAALEAAEELQAQTLGEYVGRLVHANLPAMLVMTKGGVRDALTAVGAGLAGGTWRSPLQRAHLAEELAKAQAAQAGHGAARGSASHAAAGQGATADVQVGEGGPASPHSPPAAQARDHSEQEQHGVQQPIATCSPALEQASSCDGDAAQASPEPEPPQLPAAASPPPLPSTPPQQPWTLLDSSSPPACAAASAVNVLPGPAAVPPLSSAALAGLPPGTKAALRVIYKTLQQPATVSPSAEALNAVGILLQRWKNTKRKLVGACAAAVQVAELGAAPPTAETLRGLISGVAGAAQGSDARWRRVALRGAVAWELWSLAPVLRRVAASADTWAALVDGQVSHGKSRARFRGEGPGIAQVQAQLSQLAPRLAAALSAMQALEAGGFTLAAFSWQAPGGAALVLAEDVAEVVSGHRALQTLPGAGGLPPTPALTPDVAGRPPPVPPLNLGQGSQSPPAGASSPPHSQPKRRRGKRKAVPLGAVPGTGVASTPPSVPSTPPLRASTAAPVSMKQLLAAASETKPVPASPNPSPAPSASKHRGRRRRQQALPLSQLTPPQDTKAAAWQTSVPAQSQRQGGLGRGTRPSLASIAASQAQEAAAATAASTRLAQARLAAGRGASGVLGKSRQSAWGRGPGNAGSPPILGLGDVAVMQALAAEEEAAAAAEAASLALAKALSQEEEPATGGGRGRGGRSRGGRRGRSRQRGGKGRR